MRKIKETEVVLRTLGHLAHHDQYTRLALRPTHGLGPDLKVQHRRMDGHYFIIEAKGEGDGRARDAKMESILNAMGQLDTRFSGLNGRKYGLALPSAWKPRAIGKLTIAHVSERRLHLFLVDRRGRVEHLTPTQLKAAIRTRRTSRPTRNWARQPPPITPSSSTRRRASSRLTSPGRVDSLP